jgi:predicted DNA-binding transcriptional regulator AlpA
VNAPARRVVVEDSSSVSDDALVVTLTVGTLRALIRAEREAPHAESAPAIAEPLLLTCAKLCARLGVSRASVYRWRNEGMPCIKAGDDFRYILAEVLEWLKARPR